MIVPTEKQLEKLKERYNTHKLNRDFLSGSIQSVIGIYRNTEYCPYLPNNGGQANIPWQFCYECKIKRCEKKQRPTGDPIILEHS